MFSIVRIFTSVCLLLTVSCIQAQSPVSSRITPDSALKKLYTDFPQEKVFLQTNQTYFVSGETIWMKAWCTLETVPSYLSRILYITLSNASGKIVSKKMYQLDSLSSTPAEMDIPAEVPTGNYSLQAYTLWMLNEPGMIFTKPIFIYNNNPAKKITPVPIKKSLLLSFYPEGGQIIAGIPNRIACKATDESGFPLTIQAKVGDESNPSLATIQTAEDGLGTFELNNPVAGKKYQATVSLNNGINYTFTLPAIEKEGVGIRVENSNPNRLTVLVSPTPAQAEKYGRIRVLAQINHQRVYDQILAVADGITAAPISKKNLPPGILHITLFDENNLPLAERLAFIENYQVPAVPITKDTLRTIPNSNSQLHFSIPGKAAKSISVLITDAASDNRNLQEDHLASAILLTGDLKGYIHNPASYFVNKSPETLKKIDNLLLTQGWSRFSWKKITTAQFPALQYPVESAITLSGMLTKSDRTSLIKDGRVSVIIKGEDSTSILVDAKVTDKGEFFMGDLNFRKKATINYQGTENKRENFITDVKLYPNHIDTLQNMRAALRMNLDTLSIGASNNWAGNLLKKINQIDTSDGSHYLGNVTVRTRKISKEDSLNNQYASGAFMMGKGFAPDDFKNYNTIWQMMQAAVPGITVEGNPFDPIVTMNRFNGLSDISNQFRAAVSASEGGDPVAMDESSMGLFTSNGIAYFLNEINVDKDIINTLNINDVALVKVLKNEAMALGAPTGAIIIYTKKGVISGGAIYDKKFSQTERTGYALIREFYNPAVMGPSTTLNNNRTTLYWNPRIRPSKDGQYYIRFQNNGTAKQFQILIQGIDADGNIFWNQSTLQ